MHSSSVLASPLNVPNGISYTLEAMEVRELKETIQALQMDVERFKQQQQSSVEQLKVLTFLAFSISLPFNIPAVM